MKNRFRRGVWMDICNDIHSAQDAERFVSWCNGMGVDLVFACLNHGTGFMSYPSEVAPRGSQTDRWDPTGALLTACRKAGLEIHAWVCIGNFGPPVITPSLISRNGPRPLQETHRDWFCTNHTGENMLDMQVDYAFLNPASQGVRDFHLRLCREILSRYPFDGYHLDYIRYHFKPAAKHSQAKEAFRGDESPSAVVLDGSERLSFDTESLEAFAGDTGIDLIGAGADLSSRVKWLYDTDSDPTRRERWYEWKAGQVTTLVSLLRAVVAAERRQLSAAVFSGYPWCGQEIAQRWPGWLDSGLLDLVVPMDYGISLDEYKGHLQQQNLAIKSGASPAIPVISGLIDVGISSGVLAAASEDLLRKYEALARSCGRAGVCLFCYPSCRHPVQSPG